MLRAGVGLDSDGALVVFTQEVLDGVEVMLAHIAQAAAVIIPVAAEGLVDAVRVVRLIGGGAEPEIVIQLGRDGLLGEVGAAAPLILLPIEAGRAADHHLERPAQEPALHHFLDLFDPDVHAVKVVLETEPGVQPENATVFRDRRLDGFAFGDGPGHRFFAPDIFAGLSRGDGDEGVPVRRSRDMHDIDVLALEHVAKVPVAGDSRPRHPEAGFEVLLIDIANGQQFRGRVNPLEVSLSHAADADDGLGEGFAG